MTAQGKINDSTRDNHCQKKAMHYKDRSATETGATAQEMFSDRNKRLQPKKRSTTETGATAQETISGRNRRYSTRNVQRQKYEIQPRKWSMAGSTSMYCLLYSVVGVYFIKITEQLAINPSRKSNGKCHAGNAREMPMGNAWLNALLFFLSEVL